MTEDTGGLSFAIPAYLFGYGRDEKSGSPGMTLLDWFAGQVAAGLTSACDSEGGWTGNCPNPVAEIAYSTAAAMVAERRRREQS